MLADRMKEWFPDEDIRQVIEKVEKHIKHQDDGYGTCFDVLDHKKKVLQSTVNAACYAQLPGTAAKYKNDVRYVRATQTPKKLNERKAIRWLQLCIENGAIGDTQQSAEEILRNGLLIDLMNPYWTVCRLYISLCNYRFVREGITLVENVITLTDKANVPFWNAFIYAHGHSPIATGHSWLSWSNSRYTYGNGDGGMKNNVWFARWAKDYMAGKIPAKRPHFYTEIARGVTPSWATAAQMTTTEKAMVDQKHRLRMISRIGIKAAEAANINEAKKILAGEMKLVEKKPETKKVVKISPCGAKCKNGKPCRKNPVAGNKRCWMHAGMREALGFPAAANEWFN